MQHDPEFVNVLQQLANGEMEPEEWVDWWNRKSEWVASVLNRGQWLRLKSSQPGAFGPACKCALVSQSEACALLDKWGRRVLAFPTATGRNGRRILRNTALKKGRRRKNGRSDSGPF